jgi:hypothetical protein
MTMVAIYLETNKIFKKKTRQDGCYGLMMRFHANQLSDYAITRYSNRKSLKNFEVGNLSHEKQAITDPGKRTATGALWPGRQVYSQIFGAVCSKEFYWGEIR